MATFVRTAQQTAAIVASLNREVFDGKLKYEILVLPPQAGSFKSKIGIYIFGGWLAVWTFTESDVGQGFIKGLTEQTPAHWAEVIGASIRDGFSAPDDKEESEKQPSDEIKCQTSARIVVEATKSILQRGTSDLEQAGITTIRFRDVYEARNEFYQACADTRDLRAVGFEDEPVFPIDRSDFARLQVALPPAEDEDDEPWTTGIVDLKVTSPNWDREDRHRFWKGKDVKGRERFFRIEDEHFWQLVKAERLSIHIIDTIRVQWAYQGKANAPKNIRVLRVLEFNGEILSEALNKNALDAILGAYSTADDGQQDLFSDYSGRA
ncbi:hypothetical protein [Nitratireductor indicus]|uniref:hypothetical protein n=1 Tax=Nitratireductor indicus TaxID=721133 RepID=UPI0012F6753E|nr:hypothetical protein [Nitratireductor indicus]